MGDGMGDGGWDGMKPDIPSLHARTGDMRGDRTGRSIGSGRVATKAKAKAKANPRNQYQYQ